MTAATVDKPKREINAQFFNQRKIQDAIAGYIFLAPAMMIFFVFLILPIFFAVFISFTNWDGISPLNRTAAPSVGVVEFTNLTQEALTLPAGTIVTAKGTKAQQFKTTATVELAAGATMEVGVESVMTGSDSKVAAKLVTIPPDDLADKVAVNNSAPIAGGVDDPFEIVGTKNYARLLTEEGTSQQLFFTSVKNTVYFVLGVVPTQTLLSLLLAVIVNQRWLRAKSFFRTAFYFPSITSSVVISIIFMWMFTQGGLVNAILKGLIPNYQSVVWLDDANGVLHNFLGLFGVSRQTVGDWAAQRIAGISLWDWLSGPSVTMLTIMILNTWTTIGTMMVIFLAALQNIPGSVYEAAQIDGATSGQTFRKITVPLLAPTTFFVVTLGLIGTFQVFDQIFVISSGGPANTTLTIAYIVYQNGFKNAQMGLAAATALVLFVIIFIFTLVQRFFTREKANY